MDSLMAIIPSASPLGLPAGSAPWKHLLRTTGVRQELGGEQGKTELGGCKLWGAQLLW